MGILCCDRETRMDGLGSHWSPGEGSTRKFFSTVFTSTHIFSLRYRRPPEPHGHFRWRQNGCTPHSVTHFYYSFSVQPRLNLLVEVFHLSSLNPSLKNIVLHTCTFYFLRTYLYVNWTLSSGKKRHIHVIFAFQIFGSVPETSHGLSESFA